MFFFFTKKKQPDVDTLAPKLLLKWSNWGGGARFDMIFKNETKSIYKFDVWSPSARLRSHRESDMFSVDRIRKNPTQGQAAKILSDADGALKRMCTVWDLIRVADGWVEPTAISLFSERLVQIFVGF